MAAGGLALRGSEGYGEGGWGGLSGGVAGWGGGGWRLEEKGERDERNEDGEGRRGGIWIYQALLAQD